MHTTAGPPTIAVGRREQNKVDKRDRLQQAATKLFNEHGFEATTTHAIAKAAGVATGTLFLYFPTKEDLLVAVFREEVGRAWTDAFSSIDPRAPLVDAMRAAFGMVVDYHERDPELARAFLKELLFVSTSVRDDVHEFMRQFSRQLETVLDAAQRRSLLRRDVDTRELGAAMFAVFHSLALRRHAGHFSAAELRHQLDATLALLMRGLVPIRRTPTR